MDVLATLERWWFSSAERHRSRCRQCGDELEPDTAVDGCCSQEHADQQWLDDQI